MKTYFEVCIFRFVVVSSLFLFHVFGWLCDNVGGGTGPAAVLLAHSRFYVHTTNIPQATEKSSATVSSLC